MTVQSHFTGLLCLATGVLRYPEDARAESDLQLCDTALEYLDELILQAGSSAGHLEELRDIYSDLIERARVASAH